MGKRGGELPHGGCAMDMRELRLRLAQGFRGLQQLAGPFHDTLFELVVQSLDFGLGLLLPGGFFVVPASVPLTAAAPYPARARGGDSACRRRGRIERHLRLPYSRD